MSGFTKDSWVLCPLGCDPCVQGNWSCRPVCGKGRAFSFLFLVTVGVVFDTALKLDQWESLKGLLEKSDGRGKPAGTCGSAPRHHLARRVSSSAAVRTALQGKPGCEMRALHWSCNFMWFLNSLKIKSFEKEKLSCAV